MHVAIDVRGFEVSKKGINKARFKTASKTNPGDMIWEYLHRKSPERAKHFLRTITELEKAIKSNSGSSEALRAEIETMTDFVLQMMTANYDLLEKRRMEELRDLLETEKINRYYEIMCTPLYKLSDQALIEAVKRASKDEPAQQMK